MKTIYGIGKAEIFSRGSVLAIGVFDGLHIGHQKLIRGMVGRAKELKSEAVVMTFFPHPVQVLRPEASLPLIIPLSYRLELMKDLGVDVCVVVRFTKQFAKLSPKAFVQRYLAKFIKPKEIFVGDDFRFGQGRSGTLDVFSQAGNKYGFKVNAVDQVKGEKAKIGSSRIRNLILEGAIVKAAKYLGRPVTVFGDVVRGDGRGRALGFPTANIGYGDQIIPPQGVYAVRINIGKKRYGGMANIGRRPSFKNPNGDVTVEVNIFNFKENIYGKAVRVEFIKRLRRERVFKRLDSFIAQLTKDKQKARIALAY